MYTVWRKKQSCFLCTYLPEMYNGENKSNVNSSGDSQIKK